MTNRVATAGDDGLRCVAAAADDGLRSALSDFVRGATWAADERAAWATNKSSHDRRQTTSGW